MGRRPASVPTNRSPSVLIGPADLLTGPRSCWLHLFARELDHGVRAAGPGASLVCATYLPNPPATPGFPVQTLALCSPSLPWADPIHSFWSLVILPLIVSLGTSELMKYFYIYHCTASAPGRDGEALKMPSNCQVLLLKMQTSPK